MRQFWCTLVMEQWIYGCPKFAVAGNRTRIARRPSIYYINLQKTAAQASKADFFLECQLWFSIFSRSVHVELSTVPHLKDLTRICLEPEAQEHGLTFRCNFTVVKYPRIISENANRSRTFPPSCSMRLVDCDRCSWVKVNCKKGPLFDPS